ncbi:hypothetical protein LZ30DRAFT_401743 [Colletotrichum cereale]|nr:hypothetical protein LZ30DRAFT_401743 [Colletotrichum cereale]
MDSAAFFEASSGSQGKRERGEAKERSRGLHEDTPKPEGKTLESSHDASAGSTSTWGFKSCIVLVGSYSVWPSSKPNGPMSGSCNTSGTRLVLDSLSLSLRSWRPAPPTVGWMLQHTSQGRGGVVTNHEAIMKHHNPHTPQISIPRPLSPPATTFKLWVPCKGDPLTDAKSVRPSHSLNGPKPDLDGPSGREPSRSDSRG